MLTGAGPKNPSPIATTIKTMATNKPMLIIMLQWKCLSHAQEFPLELAESRSHFRKAGCPTTDNPAKW